MKVHGTPEAIAALFAALATARENSTAVRRASSGQVGAQKTNYASSEHILVIARKAASGTGLSVTPFGSHLDADAMILERQYLVAHSGGAWYCAGMSWPVMGVGSRERPDVGKGTGVAETTALAYFLRTFFWMPRLASDDMDSPRLMATMHASHGVKHAAPAPPEPVDVEPAVPIQALGAEDAGGPGPVESAPADEAALAPAPSESLFGEAPMDAPW